MLKIKKVDRVPNATIHNLTEATPLVEKASNCQLKLDMDMYYVSLMMSLLKGVMVSENADGSGFYSKIHSVPSGRHAQYAQSW